MTNAPVDKGPSMHRAPSRCRRLAVLLAGLVAAGSAPAQSPRFDGPMEFLRSVHPGLAAFGPAGWAGLDPAAVRARPMTGADLAGALAELAALDDAARAGAVVGLQSGAVYDLSGLKAVDTVRLYGAFFSVPPGVTVAALAGDGGPPVILFRFPAGFEQQLRDKAYTARALFDLGAGGRLAGLRFVGPDVPAHEAEYARLPASNFQCVRAFDGASVEHCEISRFHWAGVTAAGRGVRVIGNDLFDVHAYPVSILGEAEIEGNRLRWTWHGVAGGGQQGSRYACRYNLMIHAGDGVAHAVDMHAWRQMMRAGGAVYPFVSIGGDSLDIVGNVFVNDAEAMARWRRQPGRMRAARRHFLERQEPAPAFACAREVLLRGVPLDLALVTRNWFANEDEERTVGLTSEVGEPGVQSRANLWVLENYYGPNAECKALGAATRARIHFRDPPLTVPRDPATRRWRTDRIAVVPRGSAWKPEVEISMPEGLGVRRVVFRFGGREQAFDRPPEPGAVVWDTSGMEPGVAIFTVEVEDERGVMSRHDMPVTVESE